MSCLLGHDFFLHFQSWFWWEKKWTRQATPAAYRWPNQSEGKTQENWEPKQHKVESMSLGSTRNVRDHSLHKGVSRYTSQGNVWLTSPISAQLPPVVPEYFANLYTKRKGTVTWVRPRQTTDPGQHQRQEDSAAAKVRESGISSTQNKVFRLFFPPFPCLSHLVRLSSDFLLPRLSELMGRFQGILIIVWNHFKGPFLPLSCINSWNEEIGLDFILTSAPQTCAYLKILILNQACFY